MLLQLIRIPDGEGVPAYHGKTARPIHGGADQSPTSCHCRCNFLILVVLAFYTWTKGDLV